MILDKNSEVVINPSNYNHYKNLGYKGFKVRDTIIVKTEHLSKQSHVVINVSCDLCENENKIMNKTYLENTDNNSLYYCRKCCYEKVKKTNLLKYGVEHALQNKEIKNKGKKTKKEKYGTEIYTNRIKAKSTIIKQYGVENPMQRLDVFVKNFRSGFKLKIHKQTGLKYQGTYEKHFLDYCFKNNVDIKKAPSIKYELENKKKVYHPDFYIKYKNSIVEIKSTYTYERDLEKNLAKQSACLKQGYNFIFIIDKNYVNLKKLLNQPK